MLRVVALVGVMYVPIGSPHANQNVAPPAPVQDASDIAAAFGNDADAATLMPAIVKGLLASDGQVFVLSRQIRAEWLPLVAGVEFVPGRQGTEDRAADRSSGRTWV